MGELTLPEQYVVRQVAGSGSTEEAIAMLLSLWVKEIGKAEVARELEEYAAHLRASTCTFKGTS